MNLEAKEDRQMVYRNNAYMPRNYTYPNNPVYHNLNTESIKVTDEIPLPNNVEIESGPVNRKQTKHSPSIIDFFKDKISLEEIILIGIIIVLIIEGVEDEFLLLMLLYILIF